MRVLLRADASPVQGTGHVMRCLTLSEALISRGHEVILLTNHSGVPWLEAVVASSNIQVEFTTQHSLDAAECLAFTPDWVVVDSYEILAQDISALALQVALLAIIDGTSRGIHPSLFLEHNLGSEDNDWPVDVSGHLLAGSKYTLVRDAVLHQKRLEPWNFQGKIPHVVAVMGGSDPTGAIVMVTRAIAVLQGECTASIVVSEQWSEKVHEVVGHIEGIEVIPPTNELPVLLGKADIAISASGTSAWELCSLGIPSVLIAVVENQSESLERLIRNELVVGIDVVRGGSERLSLDIERMVRLLISEPQSRKTLSQNSLAIFDGLGKHRVVEVMETFGIQ